MKFDPIESMFMHLRDGDLVAAEKVYNAYQPYLHRFVHRRLPAQLHSKLDSTDIVQSVWADLIVGFREHRWDFADEKRLRAFLVRAARNRIVDRFRQHRAAADKERPLSRDGSHVAQEPLSSPTAVAQADDVWQQMLAICPPEHHELLSLKRQGHSLAEIAARTGLHEGSIRRILRALAGKFAVRAKAFPVSGA
jgi:RNA polymerase sigma factor (sigma-70 family)